jgi:hypothetical protein
MPGAWDSPPTEAEVQAAGWDTPPTPEEMGAPAAPPGPRESVIGEEAPGFGRGVARGGWALPGLVGLDYETAAGAEFAVRDPEKLADRGMGLKKRFSYYREKERERSRRGEAENPIKTGLGIGAGSAPSMAVMPQAKVAEGAGLGARALASGITAGAQSAAIEGGVTNDLPVEDRLARMGAAGATGMALGTLAPMRRTGLVEEPGPRALRNLSPEARKLIEEGVPLTPGQRNPRGMWAQVEEASTSLPVVGPKIAEARTAARETWAAKAMEKGKAPGAPAPQGSTPGEMVSSLRGGFDDAYSAVKGAMDPKSIEGLPAAFDAAATKPDVLATDPVRGEVARFLKNQLTLLDREAPTVEKLIKIRSNIRAAKRSAGSGGHHAASPDAVPLLRDAEEAVSRAITDGAPPEAVALLREIDHQYPAYKTLSRASRNAGDQTSGMTPTHLSSAVKSTTNPAVYEQGGGGPLREWASAGKEVLDSRVPATGARLLTMTPGLRYGVGAAAYMRAARAPAAAEKLAAALKANPQQFGSHAHGLLAAAQRGPEALAAAHYVLSHSSPDYRARFSTVGADEEEPQ